MSQLLPILLSDPRAIADGAISDVHIKFSDAGEDANEQLKAIFDKIDVNLTQLKSDIDALGEELARDYLVAAIEARRSDVIIHVLNGPKDPIVSRRVLAQGDVVAKLTAFLEPKIYEPLSDAKFRILQLWLRKLLDQLPQPLELYLIEASRPDAESERKIVARVRKMTGSEERAKAWFNYQPLPAFDNKTPRQMVDEGQMDALSLHLDTLEDGVYA
jgi:hypothetical protein